jgi:hypothetical protein
VNVKKLSLSKAADVAQLVVLQTGNEPRVRDGYINLGTCGQLRHTFRRPICRRNVIASARPCPPVPPTAGGDLRLPERAHAVRPKSPP